MANRILLAGVAVLLVAALSWVFWPAGDGAPLRPSDVQGEARAAAPDPARDPQQRVAVDLPQDPDLLRILGRALDPFGEPLAGALVGDAAAAAPVRTAADGRFELSLVAGAEAVTLLVLAAGQAPLLAPIDLRGQVGVCEIGDLVLHHAGGIRGTVTAAGRPLPGAQVALRWSGGSTPAAGLDLAKLLPPASTDAGGAYAFAGLMPGSYRVVASAPGMQQGQSGSVAVHEGSEAAVDPIALALGFGLEGQVLGPDGQQVADALVRVRNGPNQPRLAVEVATAGDGSFCVEALPPGPVRVEARKDGFLPAHAEADAARGERLLLRLEAGLGIRGTAVDAGSGLPVERFAVHLRRLGDLDPAANGTMAQQLQRRVEALRAAAAAETDLEARQQQFEVASQVEARMQALQQAALPTAVPGDLGEEREHPQGAFACDGLDEGLYVVGIASPEHQYRQSAVIELRAGIPAQELRVELQRGHRLGGVVVLQPGGRPVAGARVELRVPTADREPTAAQRSLYPWAFAPGPAGIEVMATTTGADGRFVFRQPAAGQCFLSVRHPDTADCDTEPLFLQGEQDLRVAVGARCSLWGRVRGGGRPGGVEVLVLGGHGTLRTARAGADGSYRFDRLQPGSYLVRAFPADSRQYRSRLLGGIFPPHAGAVDVDKVPRCDVTLAPGEVRGLDLDLDLPAAGAVRGGLMINGAPGRGGRAVLRPVPGEAPGAGGQSLRGDCDELGQFAFADVPAGNYTALLYGASRQELHSQALTVAPGETASLQVDAAAGGLRGRILAPDAANAAELRGYVWVLPGAGALPDDLYDYRRGHRAHRVSVRNGAFEDLALTPGPAVVVADVRGRKRVSAAVVVPPGSVLDLDLEVGPAGR